MTMASSLMTRRFGVSVWLCGWFSIFKLNSSSLLAALQSYKAVFDQFDVNHDGTLDFDEFLQKLRV